MNHMVSSQIKQVVKRFGDKMLEDDTYEIDDLKHDTQNFVNLALEALREKSMKSNDKNDNVSPYDKQRHI